jgi:hypothetical protein
LLLLAWPAGAQNQYTFCDHGRNATHPDDGTASQ